MYRVLILGASYGSLLAAKIAAGGHDVTLVCLPPEVEAINSRGIVVRMPLRPTEGIESIELRSTAFPGRVNAYGAHQVDPAEYNLVVLAMQEPQYGSSGVRDLIRAVARSKRPCMSIMNMPPLPYLHRLPNLDPSALSSCYTDPTVWDDFDPALMTLCSPDPQAFRPPNADLNVLQVTLPTNFKASAFEDADHTAILQALQTDIEATKFDTGNGNVDIPVKLKVHRSVFTPLAKWAMLLTGNYRCVQAGAPRSIREAVHTDLKASEAIYSWVCEVCRRMGAQNCDMVPFEKYANATLQLLKPSSAARALMSGATAIERVDKLVQAIARLHGMQDAAVDKIVMTVDEWLHHNRKDVA